MDVQIQKRTKEEQRKVLMAPFIGMWNKLNSFHSIRITPEFIQYSDGSQFNVSVNPESDQIIAKYSRTEYAGTMSKHEGYQEIRWDNGSVWIRDGFAKFAGCYTMGSEQWVIHKFGTIKLPVTGKRVRFKMSGPNRIRYTVNENDNEYREGTLSDDGSGIQWMDGTFWNKSSPKAKSSQRAVAGLCPQSTRDQVDDDAMQQNEDNATSRVSSTDGSEDGAVDRMEKALDQTVDSGVSVVDDSGFHDETLMAGSVGEPQEETVELGSDFEENFDFYFKTNAASQLKIEREDHFVVVDEVRSVTSNKMDSEHDEWEMVENI